MSKESQLPPGYIEYPSEFLRITALYSDLQLAKYTRLYMYHLANPEGIDNELRHKIAGSVTEKQKQCTDSILERLFILENGFWKNTEVLKKVEECKIKYQKKCKQGRDAINARWERKKKEVIRNDTKVYEPYDFVSKNIRNDTNQNQNINNNNKDIIIIEKQPEQNIVVKKNKNQILDLKAIEEKANSIFYGKNIEIDGKLKETIKDNPAKLNFDDPYFKRSPYQRAKSFESITEFIDCSLWKWDAIKSDSSFAVKPPKLSSDTKRDLEKIKTILTEDYLPMSSRKYCLDEIGIFKMLIGKMISALQTFAKKDDNFKLEQSKIFFEFFHGYPVWAVNYAIVKWMSNNSLFPTPSDLLPLVKEKTDNSNRLQKVEELLKSIDNNS